MSLRPRPEIENLDICYHGGPDYAELAAAGLDPATILDFSVCSNPFMPPPGLRRAISATAIEQYPDSHAAEFRQLLSQKTGVSPECIIAGSGTTELIRLIALAYFRPADRILILGPTFGEYEVAARIAGASVVTHQAKEEAGFIPPVEEIVDLIRQHHPRAVFVCNPNNPTGKYLPQSFIETMLKSLGDSLLVLDEAYVAFVERAWPATGLLSHGNVIVLRSMTKDYALAGLRLGYAIAPPNIIANLRRVCPPWNVNAVAQAAGVAILKQPDSFARTAPRISRARQFLVKGLTKLGLPPLPSEANYFLVKVGDAARFRAALLKQGMLVRDCTSFGLPAYVRIAPRALGDCRRLIQAVKLTLTMPGGKCTMLS